MILRILLSCHLHLLLLLASFLSVPVKCVNLPANDINLVVVTDVHSWVGGHKRHEPQWDADYGHVVSFYEHLRNAWSDKNLFFVMNGDFMDGTGLSTYPPSHLTPILEKMPWDALTIGNHELYRNSTIEHITSNVTDFWGEKYVTSNVLRRDDAENKTIGPLGGSRYTILEGPTARVLTFGFLYDMMPDEHSPLVAVEPVEQVVDQEWFVSALTNEEYQAILCLVHMDVQDHLSKVVLSKIRNVVGNDTVVQFISGHTHVRAYQVFDERSTSFEAGHYLDTVGFLSFNVTNGGFQHQFMEANVDDLTSIIGVDDIMTERGRELQKLIADTQQQMGLTKRIGCAPEHFLVKNSLSDPKSLWRLYMEKVINSYYFDDSSSFVFVQNSDSLRYDLFQGEVTLDDVKAVSPFEDKIFKVAEKISGRDLIQVLGGKVNSLEDSNLWNPYLPAYVSSRNELIPDKLYEFYSVEWDLPFFVERVRNVTGSKVDPVAMSATNTQLWIEFISRDWQKEIDCTNRPSSTLKDPILLVAVALCMSTVLIAVVAAVARRRNTMSGYNSAMEISSEQPNSTHDDFDDELL